MGWQTDRIIGIIRLYRIGFFSEVDIIQYLQALIVIIVLGIGVFFSILNMVLWPFLLSILIPIIAIFTYKRITQPRLKVRIPSREDHIKFYQRGFSKYNLRVINTKRNPASQCTIEMEFKCIEEDIIEEPLIVYGRWNTSNEAENPDEAVLSLAEDIYRKKHKEFCTIIKFNDQQGFYGYDREFKISGDDLEKWLCLNNEYQVVITLKFSDILNIFRFRLTNHGETANSVEILGPYTAAKNSRLLSGDVAAIQTIWDLI